MFLLPYRRKHKETAYTFSTLLRGASTVFIFTMTLKRVILQTALCWIWYINTYIITPRTAVILLRALEISQKFEFSFDGDVMHLYLFAGWNNWITGQRRVWRMLLITWMLNAEEEAFGKAEQQFPVVCCWITLKKQHAADGALVHDLHPHKHCLQALKLCYTQWQSAVRLYRTTLLHVVH